jgi:TolA-binding protein
MRLLIGILAVTLSFLTGCASGDKQAAELLETARFEEKQNNFEHAGQLYAEILKKYPASPSAKDASARAADLTRQKRP